MANKILVTYASRTGATEGVAQSIGKVLADSGLEVDIFPMKKVKDIKQYKAIVAGSAIQARSWLPEAIEFIKDHSEELSQKPFAAFLVCMTLAMPKANNYRKTVDEWLNPVRFIVKPISVGLFAGVLDVSKIPSFGDRIKFRISILLGVWKQGDHRDWNAIDAWSIELKNLLSK